MSYIVVQYRDGRRQVWTSGLSRREAERLARDLNRDSRMLFGRGGPEYRVEEAR